MNVEDIKSGRLSKSQVRLRDMKTSALDARANDGMDGVKYTRNENQAMKQKNAV